MQGAKTLQRQQRSQHTVVNVGALAQVQRGKPLQRCIRKTGGQAIAAERGTALQSL